jgi:hypothetical protein
VIDNPIHGGGTTQGPRSENFGLLLAVTFGGHAFAMAIFVGLAGLILRISLGSLWMPCIALLAAGLVLAPFLYWARLARDRPKTRAFRFAIAMFAYGDVLTAALLFGAIWVGALSAAVISSLLCYRSTRFCPSSSTWLYFRC